MADATGREWEESGLLRAVENRAQLSVDQLLDAIIAEARQFSSSGQFEDDICLVGMEVNRRQGTADAGPP